MVVQILYLDNGAVSLEFKAQDSEGLKAEVMRLWGSTITVDELGYASVTFGGETFLHTNDWDDPCLISQTAKGTEMLALLASNLTTADE
jgi:hypothetical protein